MKRISIISILLAVVFCFNVCENYENADEMGGLFTNNDLSVKLKILNNSDYKYEIKKETDKGLAGNYQLAIDVKSKFSVRSGEVPIVPGKKYKLSVTLKNISANPVVLYSFWKGPKTELRNFVLAGENGNPPISKTKNIYTEWRKFEEVFETKENEDFLVFRIYCEKGSFSMGEISIKEIKNKISN